MADPKAIQFVEGIYSRVDKQVRDIVASMLPGVTIAAQDEGDVVANDHRILNFQGNGVSIQDDDQHRRVNVLIPGSPIATGSQTVRSADTAGRKCLSLWTTSGSSSSVSGDVTWGTGCFSTCVVTVPTGASTYSWTMTAPTATGVRWIYLEDWNNSSGSGVGSWVNDENGTVDQTWTRSGSVPAGAASVCLRVWQGRDNPTTGTYTGSISFVTSNQAPPSGWTSVGFNDSAWPSPVVTATGGAGNAFIWPTSAPVAATEQSIFRQSFTIPTGTQTSSATLSINHNDDLIGAWINGTFITSQTGTATITSLTVNASLLVIGTNVLAFHVRNTSGTTTGDAYVNYQLSIVTNLAGTDSQYIPKSLLTTKGDVIVGASSATPARLGVGTNGYVLTANSAATNGVDWEAAAGGMTNPMTTQDDIIVGGTSGTPGRLAKGSDGQVLTINSSSHHVAWATPSGGGGGSTTVLLDFNPSADQMSLTTMTSGTWYDVCANQSFTVTNAAALIEVSVNGVIWSDSQSSASTNFTRVLLDGSTAYKLGGANVNNNQAQNPLAGTGLISLGSLSATSHTIKVQVSCNLTNNRARCQPASQSPQESLHVLVWQRA